jgi:hypothetical protein
MLLKGRKEGRKKKVRGSSGNKDGKSSSVTPSIGKLLLLLLLSPEYESAAAIF